jgi:hypothetical protein
MNTNDIKRDFDSSEKAVKDVWGAGDYNRLSYAIFHGLKLIALAIIYHANNK